MSLRDGRLVRLEHHLGAVVVDEQRSQNQDETREGHVTGDGLEPVVVQVEEHHLRFGGFEDEIAKRLHLEASLQGQLQFRSFDDNVGEVEQADIERIEHALARDDDLLGLLFDGERANQSSHFFGRLPFGQLAETLLTSPHRRVNDLQEELSRARVEDENGAVDRLGRQVAFQSLVNGDAVDVRVVGEPNDLIGKQFAVVLRRQERLGRLGRVQLQPFADTFAQRVQSRIGLHNLDHGLLDERLGAGEPVAVSRLQVVSQVDQHSGGRRVNGHVVRCIVEEFGASAAFES